MSSPDERFKINLNQNIWGLIVGLGGLGVAEYYGLRTLYWFTLVLSFIMVVSVAFTTYAYTINYWKDKRK